MPKRRKPQKVDFGSYSGFVVLPKGWTSKQRIDCFAREIHNHWHKSIESIRDCGGVLLHAKEQLNHGEWLKLFENEWMPFGVRHAEILMSIARNPNISNTKHVSYLPPAVGTLHELTRLDNKTFRKAIANGTIKPFMTRTDAKSLVMRTQRHTRLKRAAEQNIASKTSLWLVDPPWPTSFELLDYKTMSLDAIRELRMRPDGEATTDNAFPSVAESSAQNAAIGLWAIDELLYESEDILRAWGFTFLNRIIWFKPNHGEQGRACRMQHEFLLIGVRGDVRPVSLPSSVQAPKVGRRLSHSEKPEHFHHMLQQMFPFLNERMELFARRAVPQGWHGWGNEFPGGVSTSSMVAAE